MELGGTRMKNGKLPEKIMERRNSKTSLEATDVHQHDGRMT